MAFLALHLTLAQHVEQIDNVAQWWRSHTYGAPIDITYSCTTGLQIATYRMAWPCALNRTVFGGSEFSLTLEHNGTRFCATLRDHFDQGFSICGSMDAPVSTRKRQLRMVRNAAGSLSHISSSFVDTGALGTRRDCRDGRCPKRWKKCCWHSKCDELTSLRVFVVAHSSFGNLFDDESSCAAYVEGMFRDANLVYESQLGATLVLEFFVPPSAFQRYWHRVSRMLDLFARDNKDTQVLCAANAIVSRPYGNCELYRAASADDPAKQFKEVVGRDLEEFAFFHLLVNIRLVNSTTDFVTLGMAQVGGTCTARAVGFTTFHGKRTWLTFAHELGHNLGARNWEDMGIKAPNGKGIMGRGSKKVSGVFAFNGAHEDVMCKSIEEVLDRPCSYTSFLVPRYDARVLFFSGVIGQRHELEFGFILFFLVFVCFCGVTVLIDTHFFHKIRARNAELAFLCKDPQLDCPKDELEEILDGRSFSTPFQRFMYSLSGRLNSSKSATSV